jgi:hypothetical protein
MSNDTAITETKFRAYVDEGNSIRVSYEQRDVSAGILGNVTTEVPPIGEAETREEIITIANAHLGQDPGALVYITDQQNRLLEIVGNKKYHESIAAHERRLCIGWALFFLCVVSFVFTIAEGLNWYGFGLFVGIAALYIGCVKLRLYNEIESAVVCTIILVLILLLIPALRAARERKQDPVNMQKPAASTGRVPSAP